MHGGHCWPILPPPPPVSSQAECPNFPVTPQACTFQPLHMLFLLLEHLSSGKLRRSFQDSLDAIPPSSFLILRATPQPSASPATVLIMTPLSPLARTDSRGQGLVRFFISSTQDRTWLGKCLLNDTLLATMAGGSPPSLPCLLVHLGDAAVLQDHVARDVQGHQVPQLLHKEAQHLASQLELVVAGETVSGDVQVSGDWSGGHRSGAGHGLGLPQRPLLLQSMAGEGPIPATTAPGHSGEEPAGTPRP